ncbi:MAG: methyltransferase domain-containing protein [Acidimicrobiia bacterium]
MWSELILGLDLPETGEILLAGDDVGSVALPAFGSKRFEIGELVLVTKGQPPPADASPESTGLADDQLDMVLLRDAFGSVTRLSRVLGEVYRILKPGGGVLITEFDAETLLESRPQQYPQRLLSDLHPAVGEYLQRRHPRAMDIAMSLVSTGFREGDAYTLDFPLGHFTDYQTYVDSVAAKGWRGMDQIAEADRQALLSDLPSLMPTIAPGGEFFDVEPVGVARAYKPG